MVKVYLVDTNVLIDYLNNKLPDHSARLFENIEINLSIISKIELLAWKEASQEQIDIIESFLDTTTILGLSESVARKTIEIRKTHRVKLPDAIIAATAMTNDLALVTRNVSDFKSINGLQLINPWE
ncbi:MAG: type II toxin-antitoxin system VapC family toxin [Bacteroidia bacterium]